MPAVGSLQIRGDQALDAAAGQLGVRDAADDGGTAGDLAKLAGLRDRGVITEADFQQGKDKILKTAA